MEFALRGILSRTSSLKIRQISYDIYIHPERDPGCLLRSHDFLRQFISFYRYSLVIFDREGCGREDLSRYQLENKVQTLLRQNGWAGRSSAIVIDPELDNWVWGDFNTLTEVVGWQSTQVDLRDWLVQKGFSLGGQGKPHPPKEAIQKVLKVVRKPRSSAMYRRLAELFNFSGCIDPAFLKLRNRLQGWFP